MNPDHDPLLGQTVGSYQIERILGTGGMGRVYLGVQPAIGSQVAIKVLSVESAKRADLVERFFSEARAVNHIRHENIVNVLDLAHLPDGRPYIVMEYLDGRPLKEVITAGGFLPLGSLSRVIEDILDALAAAHDKGVIHRDLKPDNVFVTPTGRAKVLDFGIAKLMPEYEPGGMEKATRTGQILGTPNYMAPEQITGGAIGPGTDLYALGVILYEASTGRVPFKADTLFALMQKHVNELPRAPRVLRPELPKALADVTLQALEKDPARRFRTASQMAVALEAATKTLPKEHWTALSLIVDGGALVPGSAPIPGSVSTGAPTTPNPGGDIATGPTVLEPQTPVAPVASPRRAPITDPPPHAASSPRGPASSSPAPLHGAPAQPAAAAAVPRRRKNKGSAGALIAVVLAMAAIGAVGGYFALAALEDDETSARTSEAGEATDAQTPSEDAGADGETAEQPAPEGETTAAGPGGGGDKPSGGGDKASGGSDKNTKDKTPPAQSTSEDGSVTFINTATVASQKTGIKPLVIKPSFDTSRFDGTAFVSDARKLARKLMPDAFLVEFDVEGVYPSGKANLKFGKATYEFRSPSRSKRPADVPKNVEVDIPCKVYVEVSKSKIEVYPVTDEKCRQKKRPTPKCSLKQVWDKAIAKGAESKNVVAEIDYLWDGWTIGVGKFYESFPDDC